MLSQHYSGQLYIITVDIVIAYLGLFMPPKCWKTELILIKQKNPKNSTSHSRMLQSIEAAVVLCSGYGMDTWDGNIQQQLKLPNFASLIWMSEWLYPKQPTDPLEPQVWKAWARILGSEIPVVQLLAAQTLRPRFESQPPHRKPGTANIPILGISGQANFWN